MERRFNSPTDEEIPAVIDFFIEQITKMSFGHITEEVANTVREQLMKATTMEEL
jgi:hypothetical protein